MYLHIFNIPYHVNVNPVPSRKSSKIFFFCIKVFFWFWLAYSHIGWADQSTLENSLIKPTQNETQTHKIILVIGDSLSAADGINPEKGWVSLLQKRLEQDKRPYRVINISSSGDTSRHGVEKLDGALKEYHPSIIILGLGSNDGLRGLSTEAMYNNLSQMLEHAKQANARVLLIGFLIPMNYGPLYRKKFEAVYEDLAKRFQLPKVPFLLEKVALDPDLMQEDGLHPNEKAQPIILDNVWPYLKKML